jgi:Flp pilus assembly protein TadG
MKSLALRSRGESGSAFVEMAVALPILVAIFIGTADFARAFYFAMELTTAARAGAQYGSFNSTTATLTGPSGPANVAAIVAAARAAAPNIATIDVPVVTAACQCALNDGTGSPWASVACIPTPTCTSGSHLIQTVTVQTRKTFTIISRFLPINRSITLTRSATLRVSL